MKKVLLFFVGIAFIVQNDVIGMEESGNNEKQLEMFYQAICDNKVRVVKTMAKETPSLLQSYREWPHFFEPIAAVHLAAVYGRRKCLETLLTCGANVNMETEHKNTTLHYASTVEVVKIVAKHWGLSRQKDRRNYEGMTPFANAVLQRHDVGGALQDRFKEPFAVARQLLIHGANINRIIDETKCTCLHAAVGWQNEKAVNFLLGYRADADMREARGFTPFELALQDQKDSIIRIFEKHGMMFFSADEDKKSDPFVLLRDDAEGLKHLMTTEPESAASKKAINNIARLLSAIVSKATKNCHFHGLLWNKKGWYLRGATLDDIQGLWGRDAVEYAYKVVSDVCENAPCFVWRNEFKALKQFYTDYPLLISYGFCSTHMMPIAAKKGNVRCLEILLDNADPDRINDIYSGGHTLMHMAVLHDKNITIRLLDKRNADILVRNERGNTPYKCAKKNNKVNSIAILEKIIIKRLFDALCKYDYKQCKKLLREGSNPNILYKAGEEEATILHYACGIIPKEAARFVPLLIAAGADVNASDYRGGTPLHGVIRRKTLDIAELLLKAGARADIITSPDTISPFSFALLHQKNCEMVELMARYQPNIITEEIMATVENEELLTLLHKYKQ